MNLSGKSSWWRKLPFTGIGEQHEQAVMSKSHPDQSRRKRIRSWRIRVRIREQLSFLVLFTSLSAVGTLAGILWHSTHHFVINTRAERLGIIANLKADQISQAVSTYYTSVQSLSIRSIPLGALRRFNNDNNNTIANWANATTDLTGALSTLPYLLQATLWSKNLSMELLNVTSPTISATYGTTTNSPTSGSFGSDNHDYQGHLFLPNTLFPRDSNITSTNSAKQALITADYIVNSSGVLLGPVQVDPTLYLCSFTVPVYDTVINNGTLQGFITVTVDAELILQIIQTSSNSSLGNSLLLGPANMTNRWPPGTVFEDSTLFRYVMPPSDHPELFGTNATMGSFEPVMRAFQSNQTGVVLHAKNEADEHVSVGYKRVNVSFTDWAMMTEMKYSVVVSPLHHLDTALIATVFGVVAVVLIFVFPAAHFAVRPITRLKNATERTQPAPEDLDDDEQYTEEEKREVGQGGAAENGYILRSSSEWSSSTRRSAKKPFRIPNKVPERQHFLNDELTDLTHTFNEMTDELVLQYEHLEDRVKQRTHQLEKQKQLAEAANEAKTLFLANVTHELRTPLNGILGMCAVSMDEHDVQKVHKNLQIVNKSGELLLALITDLLTFSKNHFDHHITIEESCFRSMDLTNQIQATFAQQAKDKNITLSTSCTPEAEVQRMYLWGDSKRITQVLINLIGNSLKFTPAGGSISVSMRLLAPVDANGKEPPKSSAFSRIISRTTSLKTKPRLYSNTADPQLARYSTITDNSIMVDSPEHSINASMEDVAYDENDKVPDNARISVFEFTVSDTGPGVPAKMHERIFEPFIQGDEGLARKYGGTGLGLSICKQLALLMDGIIELKRSDSSGSVFTMTMPLRTITATRSNSIASRSQPASQRSSIVMFPSKIDEDSASENFTNSAATAEQAIKSNRSLSSIKNDSTSDAPTSDVEKAAPEPVVKSQPKKLSHKNNAKKDGKISSLQSKNLHVLVADDNAINREVVSRLLKLEKVTDIAIANDGQEAVNQVTEALKENKKFDLIFMDVQMPNVDGIAATKMIRELQYKEPIVALTAFDDDSNVKDCYDAGMDYFLSKPIKKAKLKHVLQTYCPTIREEEPVCEEIASLSKTETNEGQPSDSAKSARPKSKKRSSSKKSSSKTVSQDDVDPAEGVSLDNTENKPSDTSGMDTISEKPSAETVPKPIEFDISTTSPHSTSLHDSAPDNDETAPESSMREMRLNDISVVQPPSSPKQPSSAVSELEAQTTQNASSNDVPDTQTQSS